MDLNVLLERLGGEILANKARATHSDGTIVILAVLEGQTWVWTDAGHTLRALHSNMLVGEQLERAAKKATRKPRAQTVELLNIDPADFAEDEE